MSGFKPLLWVTGFSLGQIFSPSSYLKPFIQQRMILVEMEPSTSHLFVFWNVKKVSKEKTIHSSSSIPFNQKPQKKIKIKKKRLRWTSQ